MLKNSKKISKCQVFLYSTRKTQKLDRIGALEGRPYRIFNTPVAKHHKIEGRPIEINIRYWKKVCLTVPKNGDPLGFLNISVAKQKHQEN